MFVLMPSEYQKLRESVKDSDRQTQLDFLLLTGIRYVEAQRFQQNPEWLTEKKGFIHIPEFAMRKKKRKQLDRWIRLNHLGFLTAQRFVKTKPLPSLPGWNDLMKNWGRKAGLEKKNLSAKTTRKTWESWLVFYFQESVMLIALSQGHTTVVSLKHYLNMPFTEEDKIGMRKWVEGWI